MKAISTQNSKHEIIIRVVISIFFGFSCTGCENFIKPDDPLGQIPHNTVFEDEATATAAVMTLYGNLRDNVLLTGGSYGMNVLMGYYADELDYYGLPGQAGAAFCSHQIVSSESRIKSLWDQSYNQVYMCNSAIEGIERSANLSQEIKNQLQGEVLFIRAITHFYLVNLFGDIPYITTTDYLINKDVSRMSTEMVYEKINNDLSDAKSKLSEEYIKGERIRANKYVVSALLARVYLYLHRWQDAETESTILLSASSVFELEEDLTKEFLKGSSSAILQLKPRNEGENTREADMFLFTSGPPLNLALNPAFVGAFEAEDLRRQYWIKEISGGGQVWYAPFKYRQRETSGITKEYSIVLRLAEQYLIRAEARVHTGDLPGAREDINTIRRRAGLPDIQFRTEAELLETVLNERKFELFTEQGHRWFDLKRTGKASEILSTMKPNWKQTDILLPIPESELLLNPDLLPQNPGY